MTVAGTTPYPWPYDGVLDPARLALVVCGADSHSTTRIPLDPGTEANLATLRALVPSAGGLTVLVHHGTATVRAPIAPPDRLLLVGLGLETAVHSTLRRANDRGYECLVVADTCSAVDPVLRPAAISTIEMSGGHLRCRRPHRDRGRCPHPRPEPSPTSSPEEPMTEP